MALSKTTKVTEQTNSLLGGPLEEVQMGIKHSALGKIIAQLTDLYTNPIEATVRETVSNALDAVAKLPKDQRRPIEVSTPSILSQTFTVRDYGIGMTTDDVRNIYSQYGASTKENDFDVVGSYGLGAKAPLSYCSAFTVITIKDGVKTELTVARKAEGNFVEIVNIEDTDEHSGTFITIPTKENDSYKFRNALESYKKFSFDSNIIIDEESYDTSDYILGAKVVLDEDTNLTSRLWFRKSTLSQNVLNMLQYKQQQNNHYGLSNFGLNFVLSGWAYQNPMRSRNDGVIVELKPGVVDFSSSRDSITENNRFEDLNARLIEQLTSIKVITDVLVFAHTQLDYFASLDLLKRLVEECDFEVVGDKLHMKARRTNEIVEIGVDKFDLPDGTNVIKDMFDGNSRPHISACGMRVGTQRYSPTRTFNLLSANVDNAVFAPVGITHSSGVGQINTTLKETWDTVTKVKLVDLLQYSAPNGVIIVTDAAADERHVPRVLSMRKSIIEPMFENPSEFSMFFSKASKKTIANEAKKLPKVLQDLLKVYSAQDLIDLKKKQTVSAPARPEDTIPDCFYVEKTHATQSYSSRFQHLTKKKMSDFPADTLFIFTTSRECPDTKSWLRVIEHNGVNIAERSIVVVSSRLRTVEYRAIMDNEEYVVAPDFEPNTKIMEELAKEKLDMSILHNLIIEGLSDEELLSMFLYYTCERAGHGNPQLLRYVYLDKFMQAADKSNHKDYALIETICKISRNAGYTQLHQYGVSIYELYSCDTFKKRIATVADTDTIMVYAAAIAASNCYESGLCNLSFLTYRLANMAMADSFDFTESDVTKNQMKAIWESFEIICDACEVGLKEKAEKEAAAAAAKQAC